MKSEGPAARVLESAVVNLWQQQVARQRQFRDTEGRPLEVVYPGRPNDSRGGDFRDAVVESGQFRRFGCIEVHTRAGGWQIHGHHRDPAYNRVVLHVALKEASAIPARTVRQNGETVPTVLLEYPLKDAAADSVPGNGLPCAGIGAGDGVRGILKYLEAAGDRRLADRAAGFQAELESGEAGQALYSGCLEALGYSKNRAPFRRLAEMAPLAAAEEILRCADNPVRLQAFWLAAAGLLPSLCSVTVSRNRYIKSLEQAGKEWSGGRRLSPADWELFKVRPVNNPVRRIIALSCLMLRFRETGWLRGMTGLVRQAPAERPWSALESALSIPAAGYWAGHYDFGRKIQVTAPFLLGKERAAEISINILLPFTLAWARSTGESELAGRAEQIARQYPRLESNSVERHMLRQLSLSPRQISTARLQQALHYLYKNFCIRGLCAQCRLSRPAALNDIV